MFDIKWIRDHPDLFDAGRTARGLPPVADELLRLDDRRRAAIAEAQAIQERRNAAAREIGRALAAKDNVTAEALKAEVAVLKAKAGGLEAEERDSTAALDDALSALPNLPLAEVPVGSDEHGNVELRRFGAPPTFPAGFTPKEHFVLGEALGGMDFDTAAKLSGARFVLLRGSLARLHRALGQFMLDLHGSEHGYQEIDPPLMVRDAAMYGTSQLPKSREDMFRVSDAYWLIPTAEVPLTNIAREKVLDEAELPLRFTALTPSFRAEAGAAGRDTRGMIRQHQFAKVELVSITTPETSAAEHERMTACAEQVLQRLGLHYRVMLLCTGDMGFAARKTYDLEVWLPGQNQFREISSCSVCGDFQARRMEARYRPAGAKATRFVHSLNGSGVAVGRALVAVLEHYQNDDGSVTVPEVLVPYMGGVRRIARP
jgi:seryl-tRNA synthetase